MLGIKNLSPLDKAAKTIGHRVLTRIFMVMVEPYLGAYFIWQGEKFIIMGMDSTFGSAGFAIVEDEINTFPYAGDNGRLKTGVCCQKK